MTTNMAVVPREPTEAMLKAGADAGGYDVACMCDDTAEIWEAMLSAAPLEGQGDRGRSSSAEVADTHRATDWLVVGLIHKLRASEGSALTILSDNADFGGPNSAVEVCADWTNWQTVRFTGDSLAGALSAASLNAGGTVMADAAHQAPVSPAEQVDDWIEWAGGKNPVPGETVEYRLSFVSRSFTAMSDTLEWDRTPRAVADIIAYRVLPTPPADRGMGT